MCCPMVGLWLLGRRLHHRTPLVITNKQLAEAKASFGLLDDNVIVIV